MSRLDVPFFILRVTIETSANGFLFLRHSPVHAVAEKNRSRLWIKDVVIIIRSRLEKIFNTLPGAPRLDFILYSCSRTSHLNFATIAHDEIRKHQLQQQPV